MGCSRSLKSKRSTSCLHGIILLILERSLFCCLQSSFFILDRTGDCYLELMRAAKPFNPQLVQIFNELNSAAGSDVFIAANAFQFHIDFITNPQAYGFVRAKIACCGQGPYNGIGLCTVVLNLCPNRDEYAFWDPFLPREKANRIIVSMIMTVSTDYIYSMNLSTILAMDART